MFEAEHYRPKLAGPLVMLEANGLLLSPFGANRNRNGNHYNYNHAYHNGLLALRVCKILGLLPKKALWSTCGRFGWSKAGLRVCKILPRESPLVDWGHFCPVAMASRESRDQYLIDRRADGFTYREIKDAGAYKEAEATLRGRWRTLTKDPEQRLRRPVWEQNDLEMLGVESPCFFVVWDLNCLQVCKC